MTREEWLLKVTEILRDDFKAHNLEVPIDPYISVGWPSTRAFSRNGKRRIGECWQPPCSEDGKHHIFISPALSDPLQIAGTLVHELVHACTGIKHDAAFKRAMKAIGLTGKATATEPGPILTERLKEIIAQIGAFKHAGLDKTALAEKKQTTRLLKLVCHMVSDKHHEDYIVRASKKAIEVGLPVCPCGAMMKVEE